MADSEKRSSDGSYTTVAVKWNWILCRRICRSIRAEELRHQLGPADVKRPKGDKPRKFRIGPTVIVALRFQQEQERKIAASSVATTKTTGQFQSTGWFVLVASFGVSNNREENAESRDCQRIASHAASYARVYPAIAWRAASGRVRAPGTRRHEYNGPDLQSPTPRR